MVDGKKKFATPQRDFGKVQKEDWKKYWQDEETKLVHFIGKDNIVFHCIIFPIMLHASGEYILPDNVPANEFMNLEGDKMSTSRSWKLDMQDYIDDFIKKENGGPQLADALRYYLTTILPETKDSEFTWKDFQTRNNSELVGIYGNFINRAVVLTHKFFEGKVPAAGALTEQDEQTLAELAAFPLRIGESLETYRFREALSQIIDLARLGNKYLADNEPWKTIKTDEARTATILYVSLEITACLAYLMEPFLPFSSKKAWAVFSTQTTDPSGRNRR
jgi:methionyl-tRNA synthetase